MIKNKRKSKFADKTANKPIDKTAIRDQVLALANEGADSQTIARTLKIGTATVSAYLAHRTRGTYPNT